MAEENKPMTGWKTKYGSICLIIGTSITGASKLAPIPEMTTWIDFIGEILLGIGAGLTAWGLGHKIEKMTKQ